jgi:hypothetical protein
MPGAKLWVIASVFLGGLSLYTVLVKSKLQRICFSSTISKSSVIKDFQNLVFFVFCKLSMGSNESIPY